MNKKPILSVIIILIILGFALWGITALTGHKKTTTPPASQTSQQTPLSPAMVQSTAVPAGQLPSGLPKDLPIEKNAQILQNFTAKNPSTGKTQSTREYVSSKSLDANYTAYQTYLKNNGWTIISSLSEATIKNLNASKGTAKMDITIAPDVKGEITVTVNLQQ